MRDVKNYDVFRLADNLVFRICTHTGRYPREELFGLISQTRRAAASIPMNLVEGGARTTQKEFAQFVNIAIGSCEEVRYQLHLASGLGYLPTQAFSELERDYEKVKRMLVRLLARVSEREQSARASPPVSEQRGPD